MHPRATIHPRVRHPGRPRRRRVSLLAALLAALASVLPAQGSSARPRSAAEALAAFAAVADRSEAERQRAARDLGPFAEAAVTDLLLRELEAATRIGYRQQLLRALGQVARQGAVPGLMAALERDTNARLLESAAEAVSAQPDGTDALLQVLERPAPTAAGPERSRRTAVLQALGRSDAPAARARLCREVVSASGRDRLPALRALAAVRGDAAVDDLRLQLATDGDPAVAATAIEQLASHGHQGAAAAALQLHRRGKALDRDQRTAVLAGLLVAPTAEAFAAILASAAAADAPFASARDAQWNQLLAQPAFAAFVVAAADQASIPGQLLSQLLARLPPSDDATAVTALGKLLRRAEGPEAAAVTSALARRGGEAAEELLTTAVHKGSDTAAPAALAALAIVRADDPTLADELVQLATTAKRPGVRVAALQLLAARAEPPAAALGPALAGLGHPQWPVRAAAVALCLRLRHRDAVPALIDRLDDPQPRLAAEVQQALTALTGRWFADARGWRGWWATAGGDFAVPAAPATAAARKDRDGTATYWNLPITSNRVAFAIDTSGSMLQPFAGAGRDGERDGGTRLDAAQRQLERALEALPPKAWCNVIAFGGEAAAMLESLQPADARRRKLLLERAHGLEARGPTNVADALQLAFADPAVDTIFLLTDGRPSAGPIVDADALCAAVRSWNVGRAIAIHTIALGGRSDLLERLARESGGQHTVAR